MKIKQKQWQLYYLGFLETVEDIDGYWGPISESATIRMQRAFGIKADGVFGTHTRNKSKEVIENIQEILKNLVPELVVDGLAGVNTVTATAKYQDLSSLPVTGVADNNTRYHILKNVIPNVPAESPNVSNNSDIFWDGIKYFTRDEFKCKCGKYHKPYCNGFPAEPKQTLVLLCERARKHFGRPAHLVSPLRCHQHNIDSGGVANSQHMYGEAVDIRIEGVTANDLYSFFKKQPEVRYTYKINDTNVHVDVPKGSK